MAEARFQSELSNVEKHEMAIEKPPFTYPCVNACGPETRFEERDRRTSGKTNKIERKEIDSLAAATRQYRAYLVGLLVLIICGSALVGVALHQLWLLKARVEGMESGQGEMDRRVQNKRTTVEMRKRGEVVWRIGGWTARSQSAREGCCDRIFSDAFFTHENGYKMCLSVYPNGDRNGQGTHLSAYFYLMKGPFDNYLSWPFKREVTLSVIDQRTGRDYASVMTTYNQFANDTDWHKPATYRGGGFGNNKLVDLATLSSTAGLIQNNTISIRCVVK